MSDALEAPRAILRDLHRAALMRDEKHTSAELAERFADVAMGLEDMQTPEVLRAVFLSWATREGADQSRWARKTLKAEGVQALAWYARNGHSGFKPLRLFTLSETQNTRSFYENTARQYEHQASLWATAEEKHSRHPNLALGDVLDTGELEALVVASLEAEAI